MLLNANALADPVGRRYVPPIRMASPSDSLTDALQWASPSDRGAPRWGAHLTEAPQDGEPRYAASRNKSLKTPPAVTSAPAPGPLMING